MGAMTVAAGVAAALFKRASTGVTSVVDISLLGVGMWQLQPDIMSSQFDDPAAVPHSMPRGVWNPLAAPYRTQDGRFIYLCALDSEPYWAEFCEIIAAPELASDDRFVDMAARSRNGRECVAMLDALFASRPYAEWCQRFSRFSGPWSPVQQARELHADAQALETGCFTDLDTGAGRSLRVVSSPVNFDHVAGTRRSPGAPEVGQHTEEILLGLGRSWEDITVLKEAGAVN
jgi:crotonobetainyl-CoA:carnitine CoA-transferase CaiB-like acyl-CoA transferase